MSDVLSDAEVFGAPKSGVMSDADVFGGPSPPISRPDNFADGVLLPQPRVSDQAKPFVNSTTTGGIMKAFGYDFDRNFGAERLGLSKESTEYLSKIGIFAPEGASKYQNPFHAFNEGVLTNTAAFLDGLIRTANATFRGAQGAGVEVGRELSGGALERGMAAAKLGSPEQLARDLVSIPDALMGTPHPTGMFKQPTLRELLDVKAPAGAVAVEPVPPPADGFVRFYHGHEGGNPADGGARWVTPHEDYARNFRTNGDQLNDVSYVDIPAERLKNDPRLADGYDEVNNYYRHFEAPEDIARELKPLTVAERTGSPLAEAQDLGVVGPDKPSLADLKDKPVAEAVDALRPKAEGAPEAQPAADGGWRDRFDHFVGKLKQPEDVRQLIRDSADENNNFPEARQPAEPLTHSEAQNLADAAGMDIGEVDRAKLGREFNEAHVDRAMQVMIQTTRNVKDAARDVVSDASEQNLIAFQEHLLRRDMAVEEIVGIRSTWGRIGNTLNKYVTEVKDGKALDSFIKETCPL